jgi:hypothetical protein
MKKIIMIVVIALVLAVSGVCYAAERSMSRTEFVDVAKYVIEMKNLSYTGAMLLVEAQRIPLGTFNTYCITKKELRAFSDEIIKWVEWRQYPQTNPKPEWLK